MLKLLIYFGADNLLQYLCFFVSVLNFLRFWISSYFLDRYFRVFIGLIVSLHKKNLYNYSNFNWF